MAGCRVCRPKVFPPNLTKSERGALITECFKDGVYHSIVQIAVRVDEAGKPYVAKEKVLRDFNAWCRNRGL